MKTLREYVKDAQEKGVAIGHFNISNLDALYGIYTAAKSLGVPVIVGTTEGEEDYMDTDAVVAVVKALRERDQYPLFLNADHHYSFESVKKAIDAGYDAVIIDGAKLPNDENRTLTKQCVDYARTVNEKTGRDILVEAEMGFIGQSSKVLESVPEGVSEETMTNPEEAYAFKEATGIDMLAPSVGNVHGIVKSGEPDLHPERVKSVFEKVGIPLVLHGASGNTKEEIQECIKSGIAIVHINTEIRVAYKDALVVSLTQTHKDEVAPYKYFPPARDALSAVVLEKLKIFNFLS